MSSSTMNSMAYQPDYTAIIFKYERKLLFKHEHVQDVGEAD